MLQWTQGLHSQLWSHVTFSQIILKYLKYPLLKCAILRPRKKVFFGALARLIVLRGTGTQGLAISAYLLNMHHLITKNNFIGCRLGELELIRLTQR